MLIGVQCKWEKNENSFTKKCQLCKSDDVVEFLLRNNFVVVINELSHGLISHLFTYSVTTEQDLGYILVPLGYFSHLYH